MKISRSASLFATLSILASALVGINVANASQSTPPDQAVGYWTEERMKSALPVEVQVDPRTGLGTLRVIPNRTGQVGTVATPDDNWDPSIPLAQTAVGKVFFSVKNMNYVCSGALVTDELSTQATVLTAGHCAWNQAVKGSFVSNWAFVPNYDGGNRSKWYASALVVRKEFASQSGFNNIAVANDWAFAVIEPNSKNSKNPTDPLPDENNNSYSLGIDGFSAGQYSQAFGYPAASPYDGQSLRFAYSVIFADTNQLANPMDNTSSTTWGMTSSMTGGASGGPWLSGITTSPGISNANGKLSSVNSYKYTGDNSKMYGPKFGAKTLETFVAAKNGQIQNKIVSQ